MSENGERLIEAVRVARTLAEEAYQQWRVKEEEVEAANTQRHLRWSQLTAAEEALLEFTGKPSRP